MILMVPIGITDDMVGLENPERYPLQFSSPNPSEMVNLGPDATVTINDDDGIKYNITQTNSLVI